jgi:hypothetical protein
MITASGSDNSSVAPTVVMPKVPATTDTKGRLRVSKAQRRIKRKNYFFQKVPARDKAKTVQ